MYYLCSARACVCVCMITILRCVFFAASCYGSLKACRLPHVPGSRWSHFSIIVVEVEEEVYSNILCRFQVWLRDCLSIEWLHFVIHTADYSQLTNLRVCLVYYHTHTHTHRASLFISTMCTVAHHQTYYY